MLAKNRLTWAPWRRGILTFVMSLGLTVCPLRLAAQSVTLAWGPSPSVNVTGYMLYYGADGINFDGQIDAGTNTTWTVTGLEPGSTNYFEVVAYDANNDQSPPSNQVEYTVPKAAQTLTVLANPTGAGDVTGDGSFAAGSSVTVTATANNGYTFANWTENGIQQSTSPNYSFTLAANLTLVANFTTNSVVPSLTANSVTYTVTSSAGQNGGISPNGPEAVAAGGSITFTAAPANGYKVNQWLVNGTVAQTGGSAYTLQNVTTNNAVAVTFSANPVVATNSSQNTVTNSVAGTTPVTNPNTSFSLLINGNGTLAPSRTAKALQGGKTYTLTAIAAKGSVFAGWVSNGIVVATTPKYTFLVESNVALQANFIPNPFLPVVGAYHGLFYVTNDAAEESSGSFVATVTKTGAFSAKLCLGAGSYSYS